MRQRSELIAAIRAGRMDGRVLIIGGGINGVGVLRDLAAQGVPALLAERADFASGTSSAPSRLIHGGLRYLETGEFALVRESVEERNHLLLNAPHQVRPIPVWIPVLSHTGGAFAALLRFLHLKRTPGAKGALAVRLGLWVFDRFGKVQRTMPLHRPIPMTEARRRFPLLAPRVKAVLEYYDARISSPERLVMEIAADAEADCPDTAAVTYLEVTGRDGAHLLLTDRMSGEVLRVAPSLVVNCAGAWIDPAHRSIGIDQRLTGGTKGSHLVLDRPDLAAQLGDAMLYFETSDFRACLAYRLDGGKVILGTTDLRCDIPDAATCDEGEIDYLFRVLEEVLPGAAPRREDIVFTFAGVRPLPYSPDGVTGAISRDHSLRTFEAEGDRPFAVIALIGGKWTTYRACAAQIADQVLARIGIARQSGTLGLRIGGGKNFPPSGDIPQHLLHRYGTTALAMLESFDGPLRPIPEAPGYAEQEILWLCRNERVMRLDDLVLRRTLLAFEGLASADAVKAFARLAAMALDWPEEREADEVARTLSLLHRRHHVAVAPQELRDDEDRRAG